MRNFWNILWQSRSHPDVIWAESDAPRSFPFFVCQLSPAEKFRANFQMQKMNLKQVSFKFIQQNMQDIFHVYCYSSSVLLKYLTKKQQAQNPGGWGFPQKLSLFKLYLIWSVTTFPFLSTTFPFLLYLISSVNRTRKSDGDGISDRRPNGDDMFIEGIIYSSETIYQGMFLFIGGLCIHPKLNWEMYSFTRACFCLLGWFFFSPKLSEDKDPGANNIVDIMRTSKNLPKRGNIGQVCSRHPKVRRIVMTMACVPRQHFFNFTKFVFL